MKKILSLYLLFIVLPSFADHGEEDDLYQLSFEQLMEVQVQSASGFSEKVTDAPAPVSIITQEMILNSGANTLRDLLTLYIPGYTQVQTEDQYNVAFRGIYTSSQQKFLVLLNNHRLNSRVYSMANPDHAIALDKVKRIEILRGPGGSVYGNVALTSVINIVTKSGADVMGLSTIAAVGNHGQRSVYGEYGDYTPELDFYSWVKLVEIKGEQVTIRPEDDYSATPNDGPITSYLDAFTDRPAIDAGISATLFEDWKMLINYRRAHYREPLSTGRFSGEAYDTNLIPLVHGVGPGFQSSFWHSFLQKQWLNGKNDWQLKLFYDTNHVSNTMVPDPNRLNYFNLDWRDYDYGVEGRWIHELDNGMLMVGFDHEHSKLWHSRILRGNRNGFQEEPFLFNGKPLLPTGSEYITSGYIQYKHNLNSAWLLNGGIRFDAKKRLDDRHINEWSPRLAAIYQAHDTTVKFSYARSFVDPAYWTRYSELPSVRGSSALQPEALESYQITPQWRFFDHKIHFKLNFYLNKYKDVVFRQRIRDPNAPRFANGGKLETQGIEQEWLYKTGPIEVRFNGSYYTINTVEAYRAGDSEIDNIPQHQYNLIFDHQLNDAFSYQLSVQYLGSRRSPINIQNRGRPTEDPFPNQGVEFQLPDNQLASVMLTHLNLRWQLSPLPATLALSAKNLFDKQWQQGGSTVHPYQQTGRWLELALEYKW